MSEFLHLFIIVIGLVVVVLDTVIVVVVVVVFIWLFLVASATFHWFLLAVNGGNGIAGYLLPLLGAIKRKLYAIYVSGYQKQEKHFTTTTTTTNTTTTITIAIITATITATAPIQTAIRFNNNTTTRKLILARTTAAF